MRSKYAYWVTEGKAMSKLKYEFHIQDADFCLFCGVHKFIKPWQGSGDIYVSN